MTKDSYNYYISMMNFIYEFLGSNTELVLYDIETMKVAHVVNPFDEEMFVGSEIRSPEASFISDLIYVDKDYVVNYRAITKQKYKLKSSTLFLKNDMGQLVALLTVNQNVENLISLRKVINELISGSVPYEEKSGKNFYENFDISVIGMVESAIAEEIAKVGVPATRLTTEEKLNIVKKLDDIGIFLVRGSVSELAKQLETTETTIYRYLQKL